MRPPTMSIQGLMIAVSVAALTLFAVLRLDIPSLPHQSIWRGIDPSENLPGVQLSYLIFSYLAHWVVPLITVAVVWTCKKDRITWIGIGAISLTVASWIVLRRLVFPPIAGPGGFAMWPMSHLEYLKRAIAARTMFPGWPPLPFTFEVIYAQKADLLCLLALLIVLVLKLHRRLPLSSIAVVALVVNAYKSYEWCLLMWYGRQFGNDYLYASDSPESRVWVSDGHYLPRASWLEVAEGPLMIAVICYLIGALFVDRRAFVRESDMSG
jgi:hypothetical protein